jgi:hypothetical protein
MEEGVKEAFCLLLWAENGGKVDTRGRPAFNASGQTRGNCTTPYDCYGCALMQRELARHPVGYAFWVCPACVSVLAKDAKTREVSFHLPGHFTEGQCQYEGCTRPERVEGDEQLPPRFSRFLQLIIYDSP